MMEPTSINLGFRKTTSDYLAIWSDGDETFPACGKMSTIFSFARPDVSQPCGDAWVPRISRRAIGLLIFDSMVPGIQDHLASSCR